MRRVTAVLTGQHNSKREYRCEASSLFDRACDVEHSTDESQVTDATVLHLRD